MMETAVVISLNFCASMEPKLNINRPLPSYSIMFLTSFFVPQWVPTLWFLFAISATKLSVA
jgi:hypothetical protein